MGAKRIVLAALAACLGGGLLTNPPGDLAGAAHEPRRQPASQVAPSPWLESADGYNWLAYAESESAAAPIYMQRANESARGVIEIRDGQGLRLRVIRSCKPPKRAWWNPQRYIAPGCKEDSTIKFFQEPYEVQDVADLNCCNKKLDLKLVIQR